MERARTIGGTREYHLWYKLGTPVVSQFPRRYDACNILFCRIGHQRYDDDLLGKSQLRLQDEIIEIEENEPLCHHFKRNEPPRSFLLFKGLQQRVAHFLIFSEK